MESLALVLSTLSGLRFVAPGLEPGTVIVTSLAMHVTYAVICRIFAVQNGRDGFAWTIAGLLGGALATVALLIANEWRGSQAAPPDA